MNDFIQKKEGFNVLDVEGFPQAVCDGLVIKVNNLAKREKIGMTKKPRWAFTYKFKPLTVKTRIDHIEWQVGKTGKIIPVAVFDEVSLDEVNMNRVTLNNYEYIQNLSILE